MPKFAANVSMLFTEHPFLERFAHAKAAGFQAVEFLFPYEHRHRAPSPPSCGATSCEQVLFNLPAGNFAAGDRGMANDPSRVEEFRAGVHQGLRIATELGCGRLNCLAGLRLDDVPEETQTATLIENCAMQLTPPPAWGSPSRRATQRVRRSWLLSAHTGIGICHR